MNYFVILISVLFLLGLTINFFVDNPEPILIIAAVISSYPIVALVVPFLPNVSPVISLVGLSFTLGYLMLRGIILLSDFILSLGIGG